MGKKTGNLQCQLFNVDQQNRIVSIGTANPGVPVSIADRCIFQVTDTNCMFFCGSKGILGLRGAGSDDVVLIGIGAGVNLAAGDTTFVGNEAGKNATTGAANSAFGVRSLCGKTTGSDNSAFGGYSGQYITDGSNNVSIGYDAGPSTSKNGTIAIGVNARPNGETSISIGLEASSSGENSIAIGMCWNGFCDTLASGNRSIAIGYGTRASLDNSIAIGWAACAFSCDSVAIGCLARTAHDLSVSIGSNSRSCGSSSTNIGGYAHSGISSVTVGYSASASLGYGVSIGAESCSCCNSGVTVGYQARVAHTSGMAVGYQTCTCGGSQTIIGWGICATDAVNQVTLGHRDVGRAYFKGGLVWNFVSDRRCKANIKDISVGLGFINSLCPVQFNRKQKKVINSEITYGFIAQDVERVIIEHGIKDKIGLIDIPKDKKDMYYLGETQLIAPMVKAIQELKKEIDALKCEIKTIKSE